MRQLGLFSGIGGFELAARWMGWNTIAYSEIDPFCMRHLAYHFPQAESLGDITQIDFTPYANTIDILTGGFPCQPYSISGDRKGTEDIRHLWPQMLRAIREIAPSWIVGENVRGLINWSSGLVFDDIHTSLEAEGYSVSSFLLPASSVGAPHERYRTWIVAYRNGKRCGQFDVSSFTATSELTGRIYDASCTSDTESMHGAESQRAKEVRQTSKSRNGVIENFTADTTLIGWIQSDKNNESKQPTQDIPDWRHFPTQSPVCHGDDGLPTRLVGLTLPRWRRESIKALGNAIVPQEALAIFRAIEKYNNH